jgi:hypothetical protein
MFARLTAAALLASIPAIALAQPSAKADEAKPVTRIELSNRLDSDYADLDANKDGKVDAAEINARLLKGAEADLEVIKKERDATFARPSSFTWTSSFMPDSRAMRSRCAYMSRNFHVVST